jgi:hypothetical protein
MCFAAPHPGPSRNFFIVALPDVWRPIWKPNEPRLEEFFLGVSAHELAHTTQVNELTRRIQALKKEGGSFPKNITDDILEETFKGDAEYKALFERERDLFFDAALEKNDERARALAREAMMLVQERHRKFFTGERRAYAELDALFLNLEGIGSWVQYEMARRDPKNFSDEDSILKTKGRSTTWSQGEGLALMLLIDRFVPTWQKRMLSPELASPFDLLRGVIETSA